MFELIFLFQLACMTWIAVALPRPSFHPIELRSLSLPTLRGVNLGGWLILEEWLTPEVFEGTGAIDQFTFDQVPGAEFRLQAHWSSYITEADFLDWVSWGINAIRIPIGYWAYDNSDSPYIMGADGYLERAVGWARAHGIKVLIDLHGHPGSQNGFDSSGQIIDPDQITWQRDGNMKRSIRVLETMAAKYGRMEYAGVVLAIELVNEPISWGANDFIRTRKWTVNAYTAVARSAENKDLIIIMHDSFLKPHFWFGVNDELGSSSVGGHFALDTHQYQNMVAKDKMTQDQHIERVCQLVEPFQNAMMESMPMFVGEWSVGTNFCLLPDGTQIPGERCFVPGCQCASTTPIDEYYNSMVAQVRRYIEAQLDVYERYTVGWFMWNAKGPGAWGFDNAVKSGLIPQPLTDRWFPGQCI